MPVFTPGDRLGDYEILARLKAGGMATLYVARRSGAAGFSIPVAIKVVHPDLYEDRSFVDMFVNEAHLSARIRHPNVVHVEELKEVDGRLILVMEYVAGTALSGLMRQLARLGRRLSPALATYLAIKVAEGLHAAHETEDERGQPLQVVHRDVSPSNILLAWQGHVKLIDFGIAKTSSSEKTQAKSLTGKLRYMSPEQARGAEVDRRTDVYALGIVLWEMLTMRRMFSADSDIILLNVVREPTIVPPSRHAHDVPPELDRVVLKALARAPEDRYASAQELRRDLVRALPAAMTIDSERVSELLHAVLGDEIEKQRSKLSGLSADPAADRADVEEREVLRTMTVAVSEIEGFDEETRSTKSSAAEALAAAAAAGQAATSEDVPPRNAAAGFAEMSPTVSTRKPATMGEGDPPGANAGAGAARSVMDPAAPSGAMETLESFQPLPTGDALPWDPPQEEPAPPRRAWITPAAILAALLVGVGGSWLAFGPSAAPPPEATPRTGHAPAGSEASSANGAVGAALGDRTTPSRGAPGAAASAANPPANTSTADTSTADTATADAPAPRPPALAEEASPATGSASADLRLPPRTTPTATMTSPATVSLPPRATPLEPTSMRGTSRRSPRTASQSSRSMQRETATSEMEVGGGAAPIADDFGF